MNKPTESLDDHVKEHMPAILKELENYCRQPSISAQELGIEETAHLTAEMLRRRGFKARILPTNGFPVVYAEKEGASDRTLLFYNHYDVQPPEPLDLWTSPPFEPEIRDGKMYARGVDDDKGHFMARLAAIDSFLQIHGELPCRVKFLVEGEEEIGSPNIGAFIQKHKDLLATFLILGHTYCIPSRAVIQCGRTRFPPETLHSWEYLFQPGNPGACVR